MSLSPLVEPGPPLSAGRRARADRQLRLPGWNDDVQRRLDAARVLVIGAGGLGSPVLQYLAGAGVGTIGVVDDDVVDESNLHRQVIHPTSAVGRRKTASAGDGVHAIDPAVTVVEHDTRLTAANALDILGSYDLVVDGSDNFPTRYLVSDAAALLGMPHVWGSVLRFDGQVSVFWEGAPGGRSIDYRDLHPVPPEPDQVLSCAEAGVLGTVCAMIGSTMAGEALKLITGVGDPLLGRVLTLDGLTAGWRESAVRRAEQRMPVRALVDYDEFCGIRSAVDLELPVSALDDPRWAAIVDVREPAEHDAGHIDGDVLVPLERLLADPPLAGPGPVLLYCRTGARSAHAARALREAGVDASSLRGGIVAWAAERDTASVDRATAAR